MAHNTTVSKKVAHIEINAPSSGVCLKEWVLLCPFGEVEPAAIMPAVPRPASFVYNPLAIP